ncbi:MAG: phospholipase D-like domain-containing protein [Actinobacteria bacterium]|nr:phospholipase D-like domain-containing protein [Actinomycetota bacterium]
MSRIIDNQKVSLEQRLEETLPECKQLDVCVGYFNLRGWRRIRDSILSMETHESENPRVRLLIGMAIVGESEIRNEYRLSNRSTNGIDLPQAVLMAQRAVSAFATQLTWGAPTNNDLAGLRHLKEDLQLGRVAVKFAARTPLHAKLYVCHAATGLKGFQATIGSSNLTSAGLSGQGELNLEETDDATTWMLADWFDNHWNDEYSIDITNLLIEVIENSWAREIPPNPRLVHLKIAYELSHDARSGINLDIPIQFRNVLLPHQESAVRVACRILERQGLVIIGDVVGLGKTMTASAIAATTGGKCSCPLPKNMVETWDEYLQTYDIPGKVLSLSMVSRELSSLRRYKLVMIDESHNLRHRSRIDWEVIHDYIQLNDSKLVLITATMYNADHRDIGGQIALKIEKDQDLGIRPERLIEHIGEIKLAQRTNGRLTSLAAFEQSRYSEDWQRLLSQFLVRRTRKFLETQYGEHDPVTNRIMMKFPDGSEFSFPKRVPEPLEYVGGPNDLGDRLASPENFDIIDNLTYARYQLGKYLLPGAEPDSQAQKEVLENLKKSIQTAAGFIRTTALKRMASSAFAFLNTVEKMLIRGHILKYALENGFDIPIGTIPDLTIADLESEEDGIEEFEDSELIRTQSQRRTHEVWREIARQGIESLKKLPDTKIRWVPSSKFKVGELLSDLIFDLNQLQGIVDEYGQWDPAQDSRLTALAQLVNSLPEGAKVLVFSEYRDTVDYVARNLPNHCPGRVIEGASGHSSKPQLLARRFSPRSNERTGGLPPGSVEIDVLISTDVLSEGQNLQDAAIVVNWDLPWTIIRIIQRAGRIDRVGQQAREIRVLSFLPHDGINRIIKLRERLIRRLKEFAETIGSDDVFFIEDDFSNSDAIKGLFDGTANLEQEEGDVDYSSYALGIWESASDEERVLVGQLPNVVFTAMAAEKEESQGIVIFCRTMQGMDALAMTRHDGSTAAKTPMEVLRLTKAEPETLRLDPWPDHHRLVRGAIEGSIAQQTKQNIVLLHSGERRRIHELLARFHQDMQGTIFYEPIVGELINELPSRPIKESARRAVMQILKSSKLVADKRFAVGQLLDLYRDGELLDEINTEDDDISIVCSMGLV